MTPKEDNREIVYRYTKQDGSVREFTLEQFKRLGKFYELLTSPEDEFDSWLNDIRPSPPQTGNRGDATGTKEGEMMDIEEERK